MRPGDAHNDRVCRTCPEGHWCNGFSKTKCPAKHYAHAGQAHKCLPWTMCTKKQWETRSPSAVRDRLCAAIDECDVGQWEVKPPTRTSDRICEDCPTGHRCPDRKAKIACQDCGRDCADESYQPDTKQTACLPQRKCDFPATEYETGAADAVTRRICSTITHCVSGEFEEVAPTHTTQRTCTTCPPGHFCPNKQDKHVCPSEHFRAAPGGTRCEPHATCADGDYETVAPDATTNRVCAACEPAHYCPDRITRHACAARYYQPLPGQKACMPHTTCDWPATQWQLTAPTPTSNFSPSLTAELPCAAQLR